MSAKGEFDWPLIGHEKVKEFLQTGVKQRRLAQAYLFYGPEKIGKTTLAKYLAKTVFCESYREYSKLNNILSEKVDLAKLPCGVCSECQQFDRGIHSEFYLVEREINSKTGEKRGNITISQIRELQSKLNKRSFSNSYKVVILKEAETLNKEAANALLKTLEEPTPRTILILLTVAKEMILETIQSRCQVVQFLPVTRNEIYQYALTRGTNRNVAEEIASLSQGRPTIALGALERIDVIQEQIIKGAEWLNLCKSDNQTKLKQAEKMVQTKMSVDGLIKELTNFSIILRDILLTRANQLDLVTFKSLITELQTALANRVDEDLAGALKRVEQAKIQLKQNISARLVLENLFLNI